MGHGTRVIIGRPSYEATLTTPRRFLPMLPTPVEIRHCAEDPGPIVLLACVGRDDIFHGETCTVSSTNCIRSWAPDGYLHEGGSPWVPALFSARVMRSKSSCWSPSSSIGTFSSRTIVSVKVAWFSQFANIRIIKVLNTRNYFGS